MSTVAFEQVVCMAEQLSASERAALIDYLQATLPSQRHRRVTRESLQAELVRRRAAGLFEQVESLRNQYADPPLTLSDDELRASIHELSKEWEQDIDSFFWNDWAAVCSRYQV
jgi:hypothetical protein